MQPWRTFPRGRPSPRSCRYSVPSRVRARHFRKLIPNPLRRLRSTNERDGHSTSRSNRPRSCKENITALAGDRRHILSDRCGVGLHPPRPVLPRLPARLHVLAGRLTGFDGYPDDPPPHRWWLGHGHPPHSGRGHAHVTVALRAFHTHLLRNTPTL